MEVVGTVRAFAYLERQHVDGRQPLALLVLLAESHLEHLCPLMS